jgi:hypothetical protein
VTRHISGTTWSIEDAKAYILERVHQVPWSGCWLWDGGLDKDGYGKASVPMTNRTVRPHRVAYDAWVAAPGAVIMHTCDVPACCNPDHLRSGTQRDNIRDMDLKGRRPKGVPRPGATGDNHWKRRTPERIRVGEQHHATLLSDEQCRRARKLMEGGMSRSAIAALLGVRKGVVQRAMAKGRGQ